MLIWQLVPSYSWILLFTAEHLCLCMWVCLCLCVGQQVSGMVCVFVWVFVAEYVLYSGLVCYGLPLPLSSALMNRWSCGVREMDGPQLHHVSSNCKILVTLDSGTWLMELIWKVDSLSHTHILSSPPFLGLLAVSKVSSWKNWVISLKMDK